MGFRANKGRTGGKDDGPGSAPPPRPLQGSASTGWWAGSGTRATAATRSATPPRSRTPRRATSGPPPAWTCRPARRRGALSTCTCSVGAGRRGRAAGALPSWARVPAHRPSVHKRSCKHLSFHPLQWLPFCELSYLRTDSRAPAGGRLEHTRVYLVDAWTLATRRCVAALFHVGVSCWRFMLVLWVVSCWCLWVFPCWCLWVVSCWRFVRIHLADGMDPGHPQVRLASSVLRSKTLGVPEDGELLGG